MSDFSLPDLQEADGSMLGLWGIVGSAQTLLFGVIGCPHLLSPVFPFLYIRRVYRKGWEVKGLT